MLHSLSIENFFTLLFWEDVLIFLFGIYLGGFILVFLVGRLHTKTKRIDNEYFDKISFVKLVDDGGRTSFLISHTNSTFEAMRALVLMIFSFLFVPKGYIVKNEKRAKIIVKILIATSVIVAIFAIVAIADRHILYDVGNTMACCP